MVAPLAAQQSRMALKENVHPQARPQYDVGPVDPSLEIAYATLHLKPTDAQQAALEELLVEQQDPASPNYHKWLTPEQFADRFGLNLDNIARLTSWLDSQGLRVNDVARGRRWITFTGTAGGVSHAFRTEIHRYKVRGEMHFANATAPSVPTEFGGMVEWIDGLNDFRERSLLVEAPDDPAYNSGGSHYLAPDDVATIYNITPLYNAGIDGSGQKIVIVGRTDVDINDMRSFRKRFNLPANDPQLVLYGNDPGVSQSDIGEANLDLEWSGAVARNATIIYVYSTSVTTSVQYAVDQNLAPIISYSYAVCEQETSPARRSIAQQANAQGITWLAGSGDAGAGGCEPHGSTSDMQATRGLAVSFPASIPEVTAVGGTEFNDASGNYWASSNTANGASVLSYIPEAAWNQTGTRGLDGTGGGASIFFSKPAWQIAPGVPNDNARDLPDVSLNASTHDAYLRITGGVLDGVGGTSVSTPCFAGMLALVNQYLASKGAPSGLGNVNPNLYRLARAAPSVFHDVTAGDNIVPCAQSSPNCETGSFGYTAGPGYDLATGLGSVDANSLVHNWTTTATPTTMTLAANPASFSMNGSTQLTATVKAAGGATPSGTVDFSSGTTILGTVTLKGASATLTVYGAQLATGSNTVMAMYGGGGSLDGSSASVNMTVSMPTKASVVVPTVTPNPIYQDANANTWTYTVKLTEMAGVATTLTDFTVGGASYEQQIASWFGSAAIPANGSISASVVSSSLSPPGTLVLGFSGADAGGQKWSEQIPVPYYGQQIGDSVHASITPVTVVQNPNAAPSCQWAQQVNVRDTYGDNWQITGLKAGSTDLSNQISQIFGTTRVGPLAGVQGTVCWSGVTPPQTNTLEIDFSGVSPIKLSSSLRGPAASPATLSVSPDHVALTAANPTGSVAIALSGTSLAWSASVFPGNRSASWLTVSPASGTGPGHVTLTASAAGLNKGAYRAVLIIEADNATPQFVNVPVSFVVGASSTTSVTAVTNAASFKTAVAPGMIMTVWGTQLAPSTAVTSSLPFPLSLAGVSATINGIAAPMWFVSPGQLNIQVPYETGSGMAVLGVNNNGQIASYSFPVTPTAPGIFTAQDGSGSLVPYASGKRGQILLLFVTGEGDVSPPLATATTPSSSTALANLPAPIQPVTVTVGGVAASLQFVGIPSGLAGVTQINFTVPSNAPLGAQRVVVTVGGAASPPATLAVTQ